MNHVTTLWCTERVVGALELLKTLDPEYYWAMLKQRSALEGGIGGTYEMKSEHIERALLNGPWKGFAHPCILPNCSGAMMELPGRSGVVPLGDLNRTLELTYVDPKNTGMCEVAVDGNAIPFQHEIFTIAILGAWMDSRSEVVYTFHPGLPIPPSRCGGKKPGDKLTVMEALHLGYTYAKVM